VVVLPPASLRPLSNIVKGRLSAVGCRNEVLDSWCRDQILQSIKITIVVGREELVDKPIGERLTEACLLRG
jgi:hypothetical protein